ncbi:Stp1/IreP family PP2C-type Ser/Thr phosphatase [Limosilactobacillus equigenerosi]|uniref:Serine threonine specific protein phosphatase n=1 Tax=Limosilactobacillus equigenerosi DSM 18793 = JCM 14505 TaxID=1423742 RepID=A0A0R1USH7_9LACO|nr:Stp1/IreP family PP2C-type Ser/Thr phosphatase [Limosilactobacillus equigenerosi]KRL93938.1 Serine threonine specific protein phosphatase [Limosilactobacillus equigenerosi DSM 18793 = JCM 14505]
MMQSALQSNIGNQRDDNQDRLACVTAENGLQLAVLADGVGGRHGGERAAEIAVAILSTAFKLATISTSAAAKEWLIHQTTVANDAIVRDGQSENLFGMGSTVVAVIIFPTQLVIGHVGDSRAYAFDAGELTQLTEDHTLVNELIKQGQLNPKQARKVPYQNVITRALGLGERLQLEVNQVERTPTLELLICSDGLYKEATTKQMQRILQLKRADGEQKVTRLIELALKHGGSDNISVMLMQPTKAVK